jgi:hypothetical protein
MFKEAYQTVKWRLEAEKEAAWLSKVKSCCMDVGDIT